MGSNQSLGHAIRHSLAALTLLWSTIAAGAPQAASQPTCARMLHADVVALEQAIVLNRFGALNPAGTLFALRRDVVFSGHPLIPDGTAVTHANLAQAPGHVRLRADKRPRPLVLRMNEGDCLEVRFHNLLAPAVGDEQLGAPQTHDGRVPQHLADPAGQTYDPLTAADGRRLVAAGALSNDLPHTRAASFHVNGLNLVPVPPAQCPRSSAQHAWSCGTDGDNAGLSRSVVHPDTPAALRDRLQRQGGQVLPGESALYRYAALREGTYFAYSTAALVGGEGDGGQLGAGLFGAVNVQPRGARWYRSQVTEADLKLAALPVPAGAHPYSRLDYDGARYPSGPQQGRPILAMLDGLEIVHSDLNAVVALTGAPPDRGDTTGPNRPCAGHAAGNSCGQSYREFTVIMHDEVKAVQAFAELEQEDNPLHDVRDNMGINYGVAGMGAMVQARNRRTGPARNCPECRAEEFFLSSWANGDPALVLRWSDDGSAPVGAMYPDDPANVHHSYLNDPVRFRNIHAGPKETHVFHLHAHQWVMDASQPGSTYLDSQTISPGATFTYEVAFGGAGNRNLSPGDSIFHCHLYPHFAQGMWELWRVHDVFEDGSAARRLPDAEVGAGIDTPAVVPLPASPLALMPTPDFKGYPFYIAGEPGHRPPQPPLDIDTENGVPIDGGLPRHVLTGWEAQGNLTLRALANQHVLEAALAKGGRAAQVNAARVYAQRPEALHVLAEEWSRIGGIRLLDPAGEPAERTAMQFHAAALHAPGLTPAAAPTPHSAEWTQEGKGYRTDWAAGVDGLNPPAAPAVFAVNGRAPVPGAPYADPCPAPHLAPRRQYKVGVVQTEITVNRHGWFDPQARILQLERDIQDIIDPNTRTHLPEPLFFRANSGDCIDFKHSNFAPNALALDDFQIYTPTDTIGQHIHLVKFDVTSSDGSGNGWNYEDGTFSPDEVRERIHAYNAAIAGSDKPPLQLKTHPLFSAACATGDARCEALKARGTCPPDAHLLPLAELAAKHPFCGAQRTVQRWWADPILDAASGRDHTLRTVFTHDHFGPSSHQQHGLYAALVIEPRDAVWLAQHANTLDWDRLCNTDPAVRHAERAKVLGGANLSQRFDANCALQAEGAARSASARPREPLRLRDDGGPTSSRANIIAPLCLNASAGGVRADSHPLDPSATPQSLQCDDALRTRQTRREHALAFADFSILYNTALEPINPETRDLSALRLGRRQVPINRPRPLGISSEDPGTQLINYRNEPVPLRVTEATPDPVLGGFDYRQTPCAPGDLLCTGDMANVFSSRVHAARDRRIATTPQTAIVAPATRRLLAATPQGAMLDGVLADVERWRADFNCALYPPEVLPMPCHLRRDEPWRNLGDPATPILAAYEGDPLYIRLIQGAQEAQHVFAMTGAHWLREPDNPRSGRVSAQPLGISEHFEFDIRVSPQSTRQTDSLYFGSSVDQLWDGMWGLLRAYGRAADPADPERAWPVHQPGLARLNGLAGNPVPLPPVPRVPDRGMQVCAMGNSAKAYAKRLFFDISAVRACTLTDSCDAPVRGIPYNRRLGLDDPQAIVFVRNNRLPGAPEPTGPNMASNAQVLSQLQAEFRAGLRRIEPLVLRAPAGACMQVVLRNHLPAADLVQPAPGSREDIARYSDNFMSMILDGFNTNQLRMSHSVGLGAPMVASYALLADGANFGGNALELQRQADADAAPVVPRAGTARPATPTAAVSVLPAVSPQGNLVPPCRPGEPDFKCRSKPMIWYAGDYQLAPDGTQRDAPIEFGAVPLVSFGDAIKHPAHGAIGALVIGPKGSSVSRSTDAHERTADRATDTSATVCTPGRSRCWRDLVLVLQDAVDAKQNGNLVPNLSGAEEPDDYGIKAVNYRSEPLWGRRGGDPSISFDERAESDFAGVTSSKVLHRQQQRSAAPAEADAMLQHLGFARASRVLQCQAGIALLPQDGRHACDPETPIFTARAGSQVRLHIVHPGGHTRQQSLTLSGHDWNPAPWNADSSALLPTHAASLRDAWTVQGSTNGTGPMMATSLLLTAGGRAALPGDYLWRSQASFVFDGGIWGLLRVVPQQP